MTFRVYEKGTDKDVTDEELWYIDTDGNLRIETSDVEYRMQIAGDYYYKLEIEVF